MKQFKPNLIKVALITGGVAFGCSPTFAQETNSEAADEANMAMLFTGVRHFRH